MIVLKQSNAQNRKLEGGGKGPGEGAVGAREWFNGCSFSLAGMAEGVGGRWCF